MQQGKHRTGAEPNILKPEPYIDQHKYGCNKNRHYRIGLHFLADCGTDCLRRNLFRIHREFLRHRIPEPLPLFHGQRPCLKYHLIGSCHLLCLHISVSGNGFNMRHYIRIDILYGHIFVKRHIGGSPSHKFQAIVQRIARGSLVHSHNCKTAQNHGNGNSEKYGFL